MSATPIEISMGGSRWASSWAQYLMTWEDFTDVLQNAMQNTLTSTHEIAFTIILLKLCTAISWFAILSISQSLKS